MVESASSAIRAAENMTANRHLIEGDLHCVDCDYNLRGQPIDGICPECGRFIGQFFEDADVVISVRLFRTVAIRTRSLVVSFLGTSALILIFAALAPVTSPEFAGSLVSLVVVVATLVHMAAARTIARTVDALPDPMDRVLLVVTYIILALNVLDVLVARTASGKAYQMVVLWLAVAMAWSAASLRRFFAQIGRDSLRTWALAAHGPALVVVLFWLIALVVNPRIRAAADQLQMLAGFVFILLLPVYVTLLAKASRWLSRSLPFVEYAKEHQICSTDVD